QIDFRKVQDEILKNSMDVNYEDDILEIPIESNPTWTKDEIQDELDNNAQTMLGYVVRWVEQGVGTSTVPDIQGVGLMEDRATLRSSSEMMANWLHDEICTVAKVEERVQRMAVIVDKQNEGDETYVK